MNLYIWEGFCPDYTDGLAVAIAESENEARELIREDHGCEPYHWGELSVLDLNNKFAVQVSGGPG